MLWRISSEEFLQSSVSKEAKLLFDNFYRILLLTLI